MLRAGGWPRREHPRGAHRITHSPMPTCSQGSTLLAPSRTFGAGEKQLIGGVQAEHGLGVSFCHGDALQRGRPGVLGAPHRVDDAPCTGEKGEAWWGACARRGAPRVPGARGSTSCLTPSIFHHPAGQRAPCLNPAHPRKCFYGNPGNLPTAWCPRPGAQGWERGCPAASALLLSLLNPASGELSSQETQLTIPRGSSGQTAPCMA